MRTLITTIFAALILFAASAAVALPDLTFASASSVSPSAIVEGQTVTFTVSIRNQGTDSAGGFYVRAQRFIGTHYLNLHDHFIPAGLPRGSTITVEFDAVLPNSGNYYLSLQLDPFNDVGESDETNNRQSAGVVSVEAGGMDLTFDGDPVATPLTVCAGDHTLIRIPVRNAGNVATGSFDIKVNRFVATHFIELATHRVAGLAAGETRWVEFEVPIDTGLHVLQVLLDSSGEIEETDEANSRFAESSVTGVNLPDLHAEQSPSLSASSVRPGTSLTVSSWTLGNNCSGDANFFQLGYYLSSDDRVDNSDNLLYTSSALSLPASASLLIPAVTLTIPADSSQGDYRILIQVDVLNSVEELDETNNTVQMGLRVPTTQKSWGEVKASYR